MLTYWGGRQQKFKKKLCLKHWIIEYSGLSPSAGIFHSVKADHLRLCPGFWTSHRISDWATGLMKGVQVLQFPAINLTSSSLGLCTLPLTTFFLFFLSIVCKQVMFILIDSMMKSAEMVFYKYQSTLFGFCLHQWPQDWCCCGCGR